MTEPGLRIDFDSHKPYYAQLSDIIKEQISKQIWKAGEKIPGEPDLCKIYGVSRTVVRQALDDIEREGFVERHKGKGTFVSLPKISESLAQKLTGFYADMVSRGYKPEAQVLHQQVVACNESIARYLEIAPGTQVIDIKRLRFVNDVPVHVVTSFITYHLCPRLAKVDLTNRSLYEFLEIECGLFIARGRRYLEAVPASEADARLLQVARGAPLVQLESISYLADGTPIEFYNARHRGDRSRFEIELVRGAESVANSLVLAADVRIPESSQFFTE